MARSGSRPGLADAERSASRPARSRGSIRTTFLTVALAAVVPFLALIAYLVYGEVSRARQQVSQRAAERARTLATAVERHLTLRVQAVVAAAQGLAGGARDEGTADGQARRLRAAFPDIEYVLVVDELGFGLAAVPPRDGRRVAVADRPWFKRAATSIEPFVEGATQFGPDVLVAVHAPARGPDGQFRGGGTAEVSLKPLQDLIARAKLDPGAVVEVVSDRGVVVTREPATRLTLDIQGPPQYVDLVKQKGGPGEFQFADGESRLMGVAPVEPLGWVVLVGLRSDAVLADTRHRIQAAVIGAFVVAAGVVAGALLIGGRTARGLARLGQAMRRMEAGDLPASVAVDAGGEVGELTASFNRTLSWFHRRLREYEDIRHVDEAVGQASDGDDVQESLLPGLLRRVVGAMGGDTGVLLLADEGGGLSVRAAVGYPGVELEGQRLRRGQGLASAVLSQDDPAAVPDVDADYRVEEPFLREGGIRSVLAAPVRVAGEPGGVLEVGYRSRQTFSGGEVDRLASLARRASQAIERVRSLDQTRRNTAGLEARLAEQTQALQRAASEQAETRRQAEEARRRARELEQRMRQQAEAPPPPPEVQVKEVIVEKEVVRVVPSSEEHDRVRAALERTVSDELRASLAALVDLPRLLVDGLDRPLQDEERQRLESLHEHGQDVLELIDGLVVLSGLQSGRAKIVKAPVDLPALIQRVARTLQPRAAAKGNRIDVDVKLGIGQLATDARRLEQILTNLVLTSIRYTEVGQIRIGCLRRDAEVVLAVGDDGSGFTPAEQARLFEPFLQVAPRDGRPRPGPGLLLTVCRRLTEALGGTIRAESEVDRGTWFTVTLPGQG